MSLLLQTKCDSFIEQVEKNMLSEEQKKAEELEIAQIYLGLIAEARILKQCLSRITEQQADLSQVEFYGTIS